MGFYKGYVRTKNKKSIDKFKDVDNLKSYDDVKDLDEFAGVLASDTILIDVDDMDQSNKLLDIVDELQLNCKVLSSRKGMHFLFKNHSVEKCFTGVNLACGITADIKSGFTNSLEILKIEGKEREILYDIEDGEEYDELPKFLYPVKTRINFNELKAGDGRNSTLFSYILTLQSNDFSKDECVEAIKLINKYVFTDKLSDEEIESITRDDAFRKELFFKKNQFLFDKFARFLASEYNIKRINGALHIYKDGVYKSGYEDIEHLMIKHIPILNNSKRKEVLSYLEIMIRNNTPVANAKYIGFKNGILNIETNEMIPFTPDKVITNIIPHNYNDASFDEATDVMLDNISVNDKHIRSLLEEMAGYCFYSRNELGKAFILTGSGSNGKSTYQNMLKRMLGYENISVLDLKSLDDRFKTIMLFNKLGNICDDISEEFLKDGSTFKKIVTGEMIIAEQKSQPVFQFEPYCKVVVSANNVPRIGKGRDSAAILRRLVIIPFKATFTKDNGNYDPYFSDKLKSEQAIEYLIKLGVEGLKRVLKNNEFTGSDAVQNEMEEFEVSNNPLIAFYKEVGIEGIANNPTQQVYLDYSKYCFDSNLNKISKIEFSKQTKKYFGLEIMEKRINNQRLKIFVKR